MPTTTTALRRFRGALASGNRESAQKTYSETASALDKAAKNGVIHKNTAARKRSRAAKRVNAAKATAKA